MKTLIKILLFTSVFLLALFSCKKEQLEMKKTADPCDCASEVSADFKMEEMSSLNNSGVFYSETDSILTNRSVLFSAKESDADYTWYLGTETETASQPYRQFPSNLAGTMQPIILVVKKEPNLICFPNDDGYDSVVKYLTLTEYPINDWSAKDIIYGTKEGVFKMKSKKSSDSILITIDYAMDIFDNRYINIFNYDGNGTDCFEGAENPYVTYRETRINGSATNCKRLRGYIKTPMNGIVEMYLTEFEPGHPDYQEYHYFGKRIGPL